MAQNTSSQAVEFESVVERCCGLDIHKVEIVATVDGEGITKETRSFTSTTRSLTELKEWLLSLGITHIAMESTGVYWKPVFNILEPGGFTIMIVNARHIKYVPGHKTDKKDSAWICKLLKAGLLKGSFVPGQAQRDLRDLTRYRRKLVQSESAEHNRLIRVLEDEIKDLVAEINRRVQPFADRVAQIAEIPGMGETSAKELLAEIGVDMSYFPTDAHLASWAGLCPGNNESAGKKKLTHEPREQSDESDNHGMCMGGKPNQGDILQRKI